MRVKGKKGGGNGGTNGSGGKCRFNTFSDLLVGNFATYSEEETLNPVYDRERDYALYAQDTYKVSQHLTLDLGLRYQISRKSFPPRTTSRISASARTILQTVPLPRLIQRRAAWIRRCAP